MQNDDKIPCKHSLTAAAGGEYKSLQVNYMVRKAGAFYLRHIAKGNCELA